MSRILIWSPNYAPELIGIPPLVTEASEWLASKRHQVDVVTAMPNYPDRRIFPAYRGRLYSAETDNGVNIRRSWLRVRPGESFVDKGLYELSLAATSAPFAFARVRRADTVVCVVPTLFTTALGSLAARIGRRRLVVWVQDLVLTAAHAVDGVGWPQRRVLDAMSSIEAFPLRHADRVVACSPGFVPYLEGQGARPDRIDTIPNWVDVNRIEPGTAPGRPPVRFVYTGNIGYTQGFDTLVEAGRIAGDGIEIEIVGGGNATRHVRRIAAGPTRIRESVPHDEYPDLLASAHVLVVIQRKVAANVNLPSKIASYLAAGRPILASIDINTAAAGVLRSSGGAIVVPPEDPAALAAAMSQLRDEPALQARLGKSGRAYAEEHLAKDPVLERLERAFVG